ncbi:unnamed protein product [Mycena citricolor]|uniref:Cullin family profile domain-containing protein n=1 Tax=Mycena citricolor TaxID=2018698 RepID=A0AAD2HYU7_9AGAR|nr:unnamed protein product [Mycena citricolor]
MSSVARRGRPKIHGPDVSIDKTWSDLANNIREIQNHNAQNLSFEENHRFAYNMVLHKNGAMLYNGVKELITENLDHLANTQVIPVFPSGAGDGTVQSQDAEVLLKALRNIWDDHTSNMVRLGQILKYMDRVYTKTAQVPEIWDAGLALFLERIFRPLIKDHLITAILNQVRYERHGHTVNRSAIKGCVDVFVALQDSSSGSIYKRDLEPVLLRESQQFYEAEGHTLTQTCDASEFLLRVEARFESEDSRTHHYLSRTTAPALRQILQDHLLTAHLATIISMESSGLDAMIDLNKISDIARLHRLFITVPAGMPCLKRAFRQGIRKRGDGINQTSLGEGDGGGSKRVTSGAQTLLLALNWVQEVLNLKDLFDVIWRDAFAADRELEATLNEAFESFINANERSSEFISLFIDDNLRRGLKGKTDTEVDAVLEKTITVFRYITEKDVFERYYKGHLAKRLLQGRSVSDDAERGMLAKLKVECGYQFTQKLEGMFNDMRLSEDTMRSYKSTSLYLDHPPKIELSAIVMTSTFWPMTQSTTPCQLPLELIETLQSFEKFYLAQHTGRRLTWQPTLGSADVRVTFKARKHDLNLSTIAMVILLLFEDQGPDDFLTYEEIKQATGIEDEEILQRHLQSLACAKFKILKKHPASREVIPSDSFSFNADFTSNLQKIKISTISSKVENTDEQKETRDRIEEERKHQTEACIVRIMKDRKHMTHNDLVNEVTRQLATRFNPNPLNIKKRIENLIDREYLERCDDRKSYNYLA